MTNKLCPELIRRKTETDPETGCWNWMGSLQTCGYGQIRFGGKNHTSHRASWIAHCGEIKDGLQVLHHCDNPRCCNPDHLYLGTHTDNMRDMIRRGRRKRKTGPPRKLSNEQILRVAAGESISLLAKEFGVGKSTLYNYRNSLPPGE